MVECYIKPVELILDMKPVPKDQEWIVREQKDIWETLARMIRRIERLEEQLKKED